VVLPACLLSIAIAALTLALSSCASTAAICEASGGKYVEGTCTLSSPDRLALKQWCETQGAVYLSGPNVCVRGEGQ
jgi:hypothetical protein